MKKTSARWWWLLSSGVVASAFVAGPAVSASSASALAGRASPASDESCWGFNGLNMFNSCGSGTTGTKKYLIPVSASANGTFTAKVRARGAASTSLPHVSCVARAYQGDAVNVSARATTTGATSTFQTITLGSINVSTNTALIFDCDATFGGNITAAFW